MNGPLLPKPPTDECADCGHKFDHGDLVSGEPVYTTRVVDGREEHVTYHRLSCSPSCEQPDRGGS